MSDNKPVVGRVVYEGQADQGDDQVRLLRDQNATMFDYVKQLEHQRVALKALRDRLVEALEPFSQMLPCNEILTRHIDGAEDEDTLLWIETEDGTIEITVGHIRNAAKLVEEVKGG